MWSQEIAKAVPLIKRSVHVKIAQKITQVKVRKRTWMGGTESLPQAAQLER